jgi:hypothetical protein
MISTVAFKETKVRERERGTTLQHMDTRSVSEAATYLALAVVSVDEIGQVAALVLEARAGLLAVVLIELHSTSVKEEDLVVVQRFELQMHSLNAARTIPKTRKRTLLLVHESRWWWWRRALGRT